MVERPTDRITRTAPERPATAASAQASAVLDQAHLGDIQGAFGRIAVGDVGERASWRQRLLTLAAIVGPGIIVMVGDNDAGGVSTYAQAGQNYGTSLLWTLLLLIPVLVVNQEMVVRLGAVTGVGHARLINERFGRGWGWFSVGDLFVLNFLTIVTEFIGISLAASYAGISRYAAVPVAAAALVAIMASGSFRRWERAMFVFIAISLVQVPLVLLSHPHWGHVAHDFVVPGIRGGVSSAAVLLVIAIVGTTVAPWQLFFQQSNIVDKRITPRFIGYERVDTVLGAVVVVLGAAAVMVTASDAASGTGAAGRFTDAAGVAHLLAGHGRLLGALFALVLFDASIIGGGGHPLHQLRVRGRLRHPPLVAPRVRRRQAVLPVLHRHGRRRRRDRAHPGRAARADHDQRPGAGRAAAAVRQRLSPAALQRPGGPRAVGEPALAEPARRPHRRGAARALRHARGDHALSPRRRHDRLRRPERGPGRGRCDRRLGRVGPRPAPARLGGPAGAADRARREAQLANASSRAARAGAVVTRPARGCPRVARLPGRQRRPARRRRSSSGPAEPGCPLRPQRAQCKVMRPQRQPDQHREREVKFDLPLGVELPSLADAGRGTTVLARPRIGLRAQYWDTADLRLLRRGITLRHRRELSGLGEDRWTLKVPGDEPGRGLDRMELSWPDRFGEMPPEAVALLLGVTRRAELIVVAELSTTRDRLEVRDAEGRRLAEVDDDVVSLGTDQVRRFREVEVELDQADDAFARRVERRMARAGARRSGQQPKLQRALFSQLDRLTVPVPLPERRRPLATRIGRAFDELTDADLGVRSDRERAVHQARVAARRLRSELQVRAAEIDPAWRRDVVADLRWLAGALGAERDLDVLHRRLDGHRRATATPAAVWGELDARLGAQRTVAAAQLVAAYDSDRYFALLDRLEAAAESGPPAAGTVRNLKAAERAGVARAKRRYRRRDAKAGRHPSDDRLHELRKDAKRLRYTAEDAAPYLGRSVRRTAAEAKSLQQILGEHHDSVVAEAWLREAAESVSPAAAFAAGLAVAAERRRQHDARRAWRRARRRLRR